MTWSALVLAGSRGGADPVAKAAGVDHKAFAPILGAPMIGYVLAALAATPEIGDIAISIEAEAGALPDGNWQRLDAAGSPSRSVETAAGTLPRPLLVTTADNPLLTPDMIAYFVKAADDSGADVVAGAATRPVVESAGSPARRTYLKFSDGRVSGCNLFALRTPQADGAVRFWQRLEALRKSPLKMAAALGPGTLLRYGMGHLTREKAARALAKKAGCSAAIVLLPFPDAAHDVDKAEDLAFVAARLAARKKA